VNFLHHVLSLDAKTRIAGILPAKSQQVAGDPKKFPPAAN
jgi:hypothetical protein